MGADFFAHTPAAAELKLPYVARLFTHGFQVFPFVVIRRCDQSAVQQVFATVRLITVSRVCLLPGRHFRTRSNRRFSNWLATPSVEPHETRAGCD